MHTVIESTDSNFANYWSTLFANDPLQHPLYALQKSELNEKTAHPQFTDRSFLVMAADEPVFGCSLTTHTDERGRKHMGYFGLEAATHVNKRTLLKPSNNFQPEAIRLLQEHINSLIEELKPDSLAYLDPVSCGIMSPVSQVLMQHGARPTIHTMQVIDLSCSAEELLRKVRRSYRGLIRWGLENLQTDIIGGEIFDQSYVELWRSLHLVDTMPQSIDQDLWRTYEELVKQGSAFVVQSRLGEELMASSLFAYTQNSCHYLTGTTHALCTNHPVLHSHVWNAMLNSKKLGCSQIHLSDIALEPAENSEHVVQASGFGGDSHTRLKMKMNQ